MKYKLNIEVSEEVRDAIFACMAELEERLSNEMINCAKYGQYERDNQVKEKAERLQKWHIADEHIGRYHQYKMVKDSDE